MATGTCAPSCIAGRRQETAPGTSQLLLATHGNLRAVVHCWSPSGDGSWYEPTPVGDPWELARRRALPVAVRRRLLPIGILK